MYVHIDIYVFQGLRLKSDDGPIELRAHGGWLSMLNTEVTGGREEKGVSSTVALVRFFLHNISGYLPLLGGFEIIFSLCVVRFCCLSVSLILSNHFFAEDLIVCTVTWLPASRPTPPPLGWSCYFSSLQNASAVPCYCCYIVLMLKLCTGKNDALLHTSGSS